MILLLFFRHMLIFLYASSSRLTTACFGYVSELTAYWCSQLCRFIDWDTVVTGFSPVSAANVTFIVIIIADATTSDPRLERPTDFKR
ncbi:hypothetical protein AB6A40_007870 [Gnathostoma spinigerum]|uniref:Secreted protein n=1 Tax=Gnathostoma spinigerum TaxID=75299 RepID=A0ABD6EUN1_9BILA